MLRLVPPVDQLLVGLGLADRMHVESIGNLRTSSVVEDPTCGRCPPSKTLLRLPRMCLQSMSSNSLPNDLVVQAIENAKITEVTFSKTKSISKTGMFEVNDTIEAEDLLWQSGMGFADMLGLHLQDIEHTFALSRTTINTPTTPMTFPKVGTSAGSKLQIVHSTRNNESTIVNL
jgi:hypothetical protein